MAEQYNSVWLIELADAIQDAINQQSENSGTDIAISDSAAREIEEGLRVVATKLSGNGAAK